MALLETMLQNLVRMEFFQLMFPFLLSLAILYGVLSWALKDQLPKSARGLIAIVLSFFVMLYSSMEPGLYVFITNISGIWLAVSSALLFLVILFGLVGVKISDVWEKKNWALGVVALIIIYIFVIMVFGATPFGLPYWSAMFSSDLWTIIFFIIILAVVMFFLGREGGGGEKPAEKPK